MLHNLTGCVIGTRTIVARHCFLKWKQRRHQTINLQLVSCLLYQQYKVKLLLKYQHNMGQAGLLQALQTHLSARKYLVVKKDLEDLLKQFSILVSNNCLAEGNNETSVKKKTPIWKNLFTLILCVNVHTQVIAVNRVNSSGEAALCTRISAMRP